ncbi:MAG TPA: hypothetical protein EYH32_00060 [Anaerolineae bacterium]|nr:hypothetical protein [Anaerolineae bacterium]
MKSPSLLGGPGGNGVGVGVGTGVGDSTGVGAIVATSVGVGDSSLITGSQPRVPTVGDGVIVGTRAGAERRHTDRSATHAAAPTPRRKSRRLNWRPDKP